MKCRLARLSLVRTWNGAYLEKFAYEYSRHVRFGSWPCKNGVVDDGFGSLDLDVFQAAIAAISGLTPTMFMTRVRL